MAEWRGGTFPQLRRLFRCDPGTEGGQNNASSCFDSHSERRTQAGERPARPNRGSTLNLDGAQQLFTPQRCRSEDQAHAGQTFCAFVWFLFLPHFISLGTDEPNASFPGEMTSQYSLEDSLFSPPREVSQSTAPYNGFLFFFPPCGPRWQPLSCRHRQTWKEAADRGRGEENSAVAAPSQSKCLGANLSKCLCGRLPIMRELKCTAPLRLEKQI